MSIDIRHITKTFGDFTALNDVSLTIPTGELVALLGPSGSGKTTLLRIIAGLETPDGGAVLFDGQDATRRDANERRVGFVFQHYALFRHMTVFENVAFGLRVKPRGRRPSNTELERKVHALLALVQLERMGGRYPSQLSGGQRQRVALARALAVEPKLLLLDEPFGALDARVREELRRWLRRLHDEIGLTSVFVTHDQEEALELADRVAIVHEGRIEQTGAPQEVYEHPATPMVYRFLGNVNMFHGRVEGHRLQMGEFSVEAPQSVAQQPAAPAVAYIRPHLLEISHEAPSTPHFPATVQHIHAAGPVVKVELRSAAGTTVWVELSPSRYQQLRLATGQSVYVGVKDMAVFSARQGMGSGI